MQLIKATLFILVFSLVIFSCNKSVDYLEKESIEQIIAVIINEKSFPLPPPPIFNGDSIVNVISKKTIDSLKTVDLNIGIFPVVNSLVYNDRNLSIDEKNKIEKKLFKTLLKDRISIKAIDELSQHNIILADTIILNKSKDWKEYDLLFTFSNLSLNSNFNSAKISVGISRSAFWGQAYDFFLKKEENEDWKIERTIEKEIW